VLPAAALAHTTSLFHGADVASVKSYPNSPHSEITVYDRECDGNYVHARYRLTSGELRIVTDSRISRTGPSSPFGSVSTGVGVNCPSGGTGPV
jgi:hypothetical protein